MYINLDKRIHIELQFETDIPKINGDTKRLRQVLNNLLNNSFEANESTQDAQIYISTHSINDAGSDYVELRIKNSGPAIDDDIIGRIFEPYVTTKAKGTGLGLAIVKKIVEEHGGRVWLENNIPDSGTCAVIQLPVAHTEQHKMPSVVNT